MKHCLKQREKNKKKFTAFFTGKDGPWEGEEVMIRFTKKQNRISLWGDDDFGLEQRELDESDWFDLIFLCKNGYTPTLEKLKSLGYVGA